MDIKKMLEVLKVLASMPTELKELIEGLEAAQKIYAELSKLGIELPDLGSLVSLAGGKK